MSVILRARPIEQWPGELLTDEFRQWSPFEASWTDTVDLLVREVDVLGADDAVLQLAITERECRLDGWIRADARPAHPGVILSFESRHGPLTYATDRFRGRGWSGRGLNGWQSNVRAIALGLEALRKVDRYGIAESGQQYTGWSALPPGTPMPAAQMTVEAAIEVLHEHAPHGWDWDDPDDVRSAFRVAARVVHADAGGDPAEFRRITEARDLLIREAS